MTIAQRIQKKSMKELIGSSVYSSESAFFAKYAEDLRAALKKHSDYMKERRRTNPRASKEANRKAYYKNAEARREYARKMREKIKADPILSQKWRVYFKNKIRRLEATDINFRIGRRVRGRILMSLQRGICKAGKTVELIGCTIPELRRYLESKFLPGMTWENHGKGPDKWHIDHKKPCSSFDLSDPVQQFACFNYTNLQPLWEFDNLSKGSKIL